MINILTQLTPITYVLLYVVIGTLWSSFVDYMDETTNGFKLPRTLTAILVVIITWPFTLTLFVLTFIKNSLK